MIRVEFEPTDFILDLRRLHCPRARWDAARKCWWMSPEEVVEFSHALDEESPCRRLIYVDGQPQIAGANWQANYHRMQAARPVPEDPVLRSQRVRVQIKAETLRDAA